MKSEFLFSATSRVPLLLSPLPPSALLHQSLLTRPFPSESTADISARFVSTDNVWAPFLIEKNVNRHLVIDVETNSSAWELELGAVPLNGQVYQSVSASLEKDSTNSREIDAVLKWLGTPSW